MAGPTAAPRAGERDALKTRELAYAVVGATLGWGATAGATEAAAATPPRIVLVGPEQPRALLQERIEDLLGRTEPGIEVVRAPAFRSEDLFRIEGHEADRLCAWVVIEETVVRVRVAGAGRDRFVFRDLAVALPLSELDLERAGQLLVAALRTVGDGGATVLSRADAEAALGIATPPPPPAPVAAAPASLAGGATAPPAPEPSPFAFGLGAFFQGAYTGPRHLPHGPGLISTLAWSEMTGRPEVWGSVQYQLPDDIDFQPALALSLSVWAVAVRSGVDVEAFPDLRLGAGVGFDHVDTYASSSQPSSTADAGAARLAFWLPLVRTFARYGPVKLGGVQLSGTLFVELTRRTLGRVALLNGVPTTIYDQNRVRPGAALELWFR